jgi:alpha-tubulin suppressor-like RCC1 family protein
MPRTTHSTVQLRRRAVGAIVVASALWATIGLPAGSAGASSFGAQAWGSNADGEMGNGTISTSGCACVTPPAAVPGLTGVIGVTAGGQFGAALLSDGTVDAWGLNQSGELGRGTTGVDMPSPAPVSALSGVVQISAGQDYTLALLNDGTVESWGDNSSGELGNGSTTLSDVPVAVSGLTGVKAIAAGYEFGLALLNDGTVMAWGDNSAGSLGDGTTTNSSVPVPVSGLKGVTAVAGGGGFGLALLKNGKVKSWGGNIFGELGDGKTKSTTKPVAAKSLKGVKAIAAGAYHALAVLKNGTVRAWGLNFDGDLGNGTTTGPQTCGSLACGKTPKPVPGISTATTVSAGGGDSLALLSNGTIEAWGSNSQGGLGNGGTTDSDVPTPVDGLSGVQRISDGPNFAMAES